VTLLDIGSKLFPANTSALKPTTHCGWSETEQSFEGRCGLQALRNSWRLKQLGASDT